jgi:hypothetical protein
MLAFIVSSVSSLALGTPAVAVSVLGRVEMRVGNAYSTLERFAQVPEAATVITHKDALASLRLASGSLLRLGPETELTLSRLDHGTPAARRQEGFKVKVGRIWAGVLRLLGGESRFEVATDNAVAGVRGTAFFVSAEGGRTSFVVDHGTLAISQGTSEIELDGPGAALEVGVGDPGSISHLSGPSLAALRESVGGARAALGVGFGGLNVAALLQASGRESWRRALVGPGFVADAPSGAALAIPLPGNRTDLTIQVRLPVSGL